MGGMHSFTARYLSLVNTNSMQSCCSKDGKCGFGPDYCGAGCQSKCEATAMCGKYSVGGSQKCGMNLCCSAYGKEFKT